MDWQSSSNKASIIRPCRRRTHRSTSGARKACGPPMRSHDTRKDTGGRSHHPLGEQQGINRGPLLHQQSIKVPVEPFPVHRIGRSWAFVCHRHCRYCCCSSRPDENECGIAARDGRFAFAAAPSRRLRRPWRRRAPFLCAVRQPPPRRNRPARHGVAPRRSSRGRPPAIPAVPPPRSLRLPDWS